MMNAMQRYFPNSWLRLILYLPHSLYMIGFGAATLHGNPKAATIIYLQNEWGVPSELIGVLFITAGVGVLLRRSQLTVFFAYCVQFFYFLSLTWIVTYNKLTVSAILQGAIILVSLVIMLHFAAYMERVDGD